MKTLRAILLIVGSGIIGTLISIAFSIEIKHLIKDMNFDYFIFNHWIFTVIMIVWSVGIYLLFTDKPHTIK